MVRLFTVAAPLRTGLFADTPMTALPPKGEPLLQFASLLQLLFAVPFHVVADVLTTTLSTNRSLSAFDMVDSP